MAEQGIYPPQYPPVHDQNSPYPPPPPYTPGKDHNFLYPPPYAPPQGQNHHFQTVVHDDPSTPMHNSEIKPMMRMSVPPPLDCHGDPSDPFRAGTYIVQIPKDQIYRHPPPENAYFADRHCNTEKMKRKRCCSRCCCCCIFITLFIIAVIALTIGLIYHLLFKPKPPSFDVKGMVVSNSSKSSLLDYKITMKAENKNPIVSYSYNEGGAIWILFKNQKIAEGKYPTFDQSHKKTKMFNVTLASIKTNISLPKDIESNINGSNHHTYVHVPLILRMHVPSQTTAWLVNTGQVKFNTECEFTVDTMAPNAGSQVLFQNCASYR